MLDIGSKVAVFGEELAPGEASSSGINLSWRFSTSCSCINLLGDIMNNFSKILAAVLMVGASAPVLAQSTDTETTTGSVTIIRGISLTKVTDLSFGTVIRPSTGSGTVTMGVGSDTPVVTGTGASLLASSSHARASYTAAGEGNQAYTITVPPTFDMGGITVTLTSSLSSTGSFSGSLGSAGSLVGGPLYVGGSFAITSGMATGLYTGTFDTTIQYN